MANKVQARLSRDTDARASGLVINTCGWIDGGGYELIQHCMQAFAVDVVLVMGHDKLYSKISAEAGEGVVVVKLPRSGGVVERVRCEYHSIFRYVAILENQISFQEK
jgi:polyribonucleotide 5'-hydroxyl-kinase